MLKTFPKLALILGYIMNLNACSNSFVTWQEEVKLSDGRVITVTQKKQCENIYICREVWLTINLPDISSEPIVWHENLKALVVNVYAGRLYVIGMPPTEREFGMYGRPALPYLGFIWKNSQWNRIPIVEIPEQIYDTNMLMEGTPAGYAEVLKLKDVKKALLATPTTVTIAQKELSVTLGYSRAETRIDPKTTNNFN